MTSTLASTTKTVAKGPQPQGKQSFEVTMHQLKLQWIMAKDDAERRKASEEIRRQIQISSGQKSG